MAPHTFMRTYTGNFAAFVRLALMPAEAQA